MGKSKSKVEVTSTSWNIYEDTHMSVFIVSDLAGVCPTEAGDPLS